MLKVSCAASHRSDQTCCPCRLSVAEKENWELMPCGAVAKDRGLGTGQTQHCHGDKFLTTGIQLLVDILVQHPPGLQLTSYGKTCLYERLDSVALLLCPRARNGLSR